MVCVGVLSGCAGHRVPDRIISTDWHTVEAVAPATEIAAYLDHDDVRHGRIQAATAQGLVISERTGASGIPRERIARVALRISDGASRTPSIVKTAIVSGVISGLAGLFVASVGENGLTRGEGWIIFVVGTAAGTAIGAAHAPVVRFHERVMYIRP